MNLVPSPLTPARQDSLKEWLSSPALDILIEVIKSRAFRYAFEATEAREKSEGGKFPEYATEAIEKDRLADRERTLIAVLNELAKLESYETVTARPS